jgi:hypothetical protein
MVSKRWATGFTSHAEYGSQGLSMPESHISLVTGLILIRVANSDSLR